MIPFNNLIEGIELTDINLVWVSDITYSRIGDVFYHITFTMVLYSRLIVGHAVSRGLRTEMTTTSTQVRIEAPWH